MRTQETDIAAVSARQWLPSLWLARLRRAHPDHHAIARGMVSVAFFVFLGKLAGAGKEMAVAYRYGVSAEVDAYNFVFNLLVLPVSVWFSVLSVVLVPLAARIRQGAPAQLPRFRAELFGLSLAIGVGLATAMALGVSWLVRCSWTGVPELTRTLTLGIVPPLALLVPLGVLISLFSAWTLAAQRHVNTLYEGLPALAIIAALVAFPGGVEPLVWGTVTGFAIQLASLALSLRQRGEIEMPRLRPTSPHWTPFWRGFGVMLIGQAVISLTNIIDQFFAAHLGTGAIATLGYATRILALLLGLGAMAIGRATLPVFSAAHIKGPSHVRHLVRRWAGLMFVVGAIALTIGWWLAPWAVALLFERGAFTPANTSEVAHVLRYGLLQVPLYFAASVMVAHVASQRNYSLLTVLGGVGLLVKTTFSALFASRYGLPGLMLSTLFLYLANAALLFWHLGYAKR